MIDDIITIIVSFILFWCFIGILVGSYYLVKMVLCYIGRIFCE